MRTFSSAPNYEARHNDLRCGGKNPPVIKLERRFLFLFDRAS